MKNHTLLLFIPLVIYACGKKEPAVNKAPSAFTVSVTNTTDKTATLSWTEAKDPEGSAVTYAITLNSQSAASNLTATNYALTGLVKNTNYTGVVTASDASGNKTEATFSFSSTDAPTPSDFTITAGTTTNKSIAFSWSASTLPGGGVVSYDVFVSNVLKQSNITVLTYLLEGLTPDTDQQIKVVAKSAEGKSLEKTITIRTKTNTAPAAFTISKTEHGFSFVTLSCNLSSDADGDTLTYYLSRNGNVLGSITKNPSGNFTYVVKPLASSTTYDLGIVAVDQFGAQTTSNIINVTTDVAPENNFIISAKPGSDVIVEWVANSQQRFDISASDYEVDGVKQSLYYVQTNLLDLPNNQLYVKLYIPLSKFPQNKISSLKINLVWGQHESATQSQTNNVAVFNYTATPATVSDARIKFYSNSGTGDVLMHFTNDVISAYTDWTIEQIKLGDAVTTGSATVASAGPSTVYRVSSAFSEKEFNYLKNYSTGYIIIKDSGGYHRLPFTYTVQ